MLVHFDGSLPITLTCDASPYGVGAVLGHILPDGSEAAVAFYSCAMNATERRYAQIDREALAIIQGVKKFHIFLFGHSFQIFTDHKPLLVLFASDRPTPQMLSPRMQRWALFLNAYTYQLLYRPGTTIAHADGLSRLPCALPVEDEDKLCDVLLIESVRSPPLQADEIGQASRKDPVLSRVLQWVLKGWPLRCPEEEFRPFFIRQTGLSFVGL